MKNQLVSLDHLKEECENLDPSKFLYLEALILAAIGEIEMHRNHAKDHLDYMNLIKQIRNKQ